MTDLEAGRGAFAAMGRLCDTLSGLTERFKGTASAMRALRRAMRPAERCPRYGVWRTSTRMDIHGKPVSVWELCERGRGGRHDSELFVTRMDGRFAWSADYTIERGTSGTARTLYGAKAAAAAALKRLKMRVRR